MGSEDVHELSGFNPADGSDAGLDRTEARHGPQGDPLKMLHLRWATGKDDALTSHDPPPFFTSSVVRIALYSLRLTPYA